MTPANLEESSELHKILYYDVSDLCDMVERGKRPLIFRLLYTGISESTNQSVSSIMQ